MTADNASDVWTGMELLMGMFNTNNNTSRAVKDVHILCIAYVVDLAVEDSLNLIHRNVSAIRALLPEIRCLVERRDLYALTQKQSELSMPLPSLDVETRWSSTSNMINNRQKSKPILNFITTRLYDLRQFAVTDNDWRTSSPVAKFVQNAASLTDCQSGSTYETLSMTIFAFRALATKSRTAMDAGDPVMKPNTEKLLSKVDKCDEVLSGETAQLAKKVDSSFGNDILSDSALLRKYIEMPCNGDSSNIDSNYGAP